MPSHPFQKFPSLRKFLDWFQGLGGLAETGSNEWGSFIRLIAPESGLEVMEYGLNLEDTLNPAELERLESCLGIQSPWSPKFDEE